MSESERIIEEYARRSAVVPADRYSLADPAQLVLRQSRERAALRLLGLEGMLPLAGRSILDVGCGFGQWLVDFATWGATRSHLAGIDLIEERIADARQRQPSADLRIGDGSSLPWPDSSFDVVLQSTVFSSILDGATRRALAAEMTRVLATDGIVLWYDLVVSNPSNPAVLGINLHAMENLFPDFSVRSQRITLAPPIARRLTRRSHLAAVLLEATRLLNTHRMATLRRR